VAYPLRQAKKPMPITAMAVEEQSMISKIICLLVATFLLKTLSPVEAHQPPKVPRVGYVASAGTASTDGSYNALREGLQDLGYCQT
jgi:hypothetical protein